MSRTLQVTPLKKRIYDQVARIGKAMASPGRLELLDLLAQGPRVVDALARQTGQTVATTSHHLQVLRRARLVDAERTGLFVTYRLAEPQVGEFFLQLRQLAEARLTEVETVTRQYFEQRGTLEPVDRDELLRRMRARTVTLIDVRPREEYVAAHLPGAVSMPLADLKNRIAELDARRAIVAYCRGPYCLMALDAVDLLRQKGFRAFRLDMGVPEWRTRGFRVESGDRRPPRERTPARAVRRRVRPASRGSQFHREG